MSKMLDIGKVIQFWCGGGSQWIHTRFAQKRLYLDVNTIHTGMIFLYVVAVDICKPKSTQPARL